MIDTVAQRIVPSDEVKAQITSRFPYGQYLSEGLIEFDQIPSSALSDTDERDLADLQRTFAYSREDVEIVLRSMATSGRRSFGLDGKRHPARRSFPSPGSSL